MSAVAERPVIFRSSLTESQSPYSFQRDPQKRVAHGGVFEIPWMDSIIEKDENGKQVRRTIRYIAAAKSIYLDEQVKEGYGLQYGKSMESQNRRQPDDFIRIISGILQVSKTQQSNLFEYLTKCNFNGSNPNRDTSSKILFYFEDLAADSKKEFDKQKRVDIARAAVANLEGNVRKQQELTTLFNLDPHLDEASLLIELGKRAQQDPELILSSLQSDRNSVEIVARQAVKDGIVEFTGTKYAYVATGDKIIGFKGLQSEEVAFKSFVKFLESDNGEPYYKHIKTMIQSQTANQKAAEISN